MIGSLILVPAVFAVVSAVIASAKFRRWLCCCGSFMQVAMILSLWYFPQNETEYLSADPCGLFFLTLTATVFAFVSLFRLRDKHVVGTLSGRWTCFAHFMLLSMLSLSMLAQYYGLYLSGLAVSILVCAPLIYERRTPEAAAAVWKFLFSGSLATALLTSGLLILSAPGDLFSFEEIIETPEILNPELLGLAMIPIFAAFALLTGLIPGWLTECSECTPMSSVFLLCSGLSGGAFLGVLRFYQMAASLEILIRWTPLLMIAGLVSLALCALFMAVQNYYKRLLTYVFIAQNAIVWFTLGFGIELIPSAMLHYMNTIFIGGVLFLTADVIRSQGGGGLSERSGDLYRRSRTAAVFWVTGLFALSAFPPFGLFATLLHLIYAGISQYAFGIFFVVILLFIIFASFSYHLLRMLPPAKEQLPKFRFGWCKFWAVAGFIVISLILGISIPERIQECLHVIIQPFSGKGG